MTSSVIPIKKFQDMSGLSDSSLALFLKSYGTVCSVDPEQGLMIDPDKVEVQTALQEIFKTRAEAWNTNHDVLLAMTRRIVSSEFDKLIDEAFDAHESAALKDAKK